MLLLRRVIERLHLPYVEKLSNAMYEAIEPKISMAIVTRAYNRLEYTIRCIDSVARQSTKFNYIHVIVDQNSNDGTNQWCEWIINSSKLYWFHLGYIRLKKNIGDWGGLVLVEKILSPKYKKIVQLDNDMELVDPRTLEYLCQAHYIKGEENIIMARRIGAGDPRGRTGGNVPLKPMGRLGIIKFEKGFTRIYEVNHPVACFLVGRSLLQQAITMGCDAACKLCQSINQGKEKRQCRVYKLHDIKAIHIQGWDGKRFLQHEKYYRGSVDLGGEYVKVPLEEIRANPWQFVDFTIAPRVNGDWLVRGDD